MKKCLVVLMVLVLAMGAFSLCAFAEDSPEGGLISETATGVDANGNNVQVKIVDAVSKDITPFEKEFNKIKKKNGSMEILDHVDIEAVGDVSLLTFPITLTIPVSGATVGTKGYFLLKKADGTIVKIEATMGNGTATATFPELGEVVFVSDMRSKSSDIGEPDNGKKGDESGKKGSKTSDKTGDNTVPFVAVIMISSLALGVSAKKLFAK